MAKKKEEEPEVQTVPMVRGDETADVHPDEVVNWEPFGWSVQSGDV